MAISVDFPPTAKHPSTRTTIDMISGEITILEGSFREFTENGGDILPWLVAWVSLIT